MRATLPLGAFMAILALAGPAAAAETAVICNPRVSIANVRAGPGAKNFALVDTLPNKTPIKVLDRTMNQEAGREWAKIEFRGTKTGKTETGYVDSISVTKECVQTAAASTGPAKAPSAPAPSASAGQGDAFADLRATVQAHPEWLWSAVFSADGQRLATAATDKTPRVWDVATGKQVAVLTGHTDHGQIIGFSADRARVATRSFGDRTTRVWEVESGRQIASVTGPGEFSTSGDFSRDGARLATSSPNGDAHIWDAASGALLRTLSGHGARVQKAVFSPDGKLVATAAHDNTARIWDAGSGAARATLTGHGNQVSDIAFTPDGLKAVTASLDESIAVWDVASGRRIAQFPCKLCEFVISPDGARIATRAFSGNEARVWSASTGQLVATLKGHSNSPASIAFSPDGLRIITGGSDKTIRLWHAATGKALGVLRVPVDYTRAVVFSPDGTQLVTGSDDGKARFWSVRLGDDQREFSQKKQAQQDETARLEKERDESVAALDCDRTKALDARVPTAAKYVGCVKAMRDKALAALECEKVRDLDGKAKEDPKAELCLFQKVGKSGTAREIYQKAVDFDLAKDRPKAKSLYQILRERFPNDDLAIEAAKRLTAMGDVESAEAASARAASAASSAAERAAAAQRDTQQAIERARQDATYQRNQDYSACRRGYDNCIWSCSGLSNGTNCRDNCRSRHASCN
jgi:WD40 repeat protein